MSTAGGVLYAVRAVGTEYVKIGITRGPVDKRMKDMQIAQPFPLELVGTFVVEDKR